VAACVDQEQDNHEGAQRPPLCAGIGTGTPKDRSSLLPTFVLLGWPRTWGRGGLVMPVRGARQRAPFGTREPARPLPPGSKQWATVCLPGCPPRRRLPFLAVRLPASGGTGEAALLRRRRLSVPGLDNPRAQTREAAWLSRNTRVPRGHPAPCVRRGGAGGRRFSTSSRSAIAELVERKAERLTLRLELIPDVCL
jgi:hypothetical protein